MLAGSGVVAQLAVRNGAVIAPGNSIGTLTVAGDVTFETGSIYEVEADPATDASDRIVAGGTATLNGGVVRHVGYPGAYGPSSTYTILTAAGGVTGRFDAIETDFAFLDASLDYESDAVLMLLERNAVSFPAVGETFNQRAAGAGIESTGTEANLYNAVVGLSADEARKAFDQLSGELHGSVRTSLIEDATWIRSVAQQRTRAVDPDATGVQLWGRAHGALARMGTDDNAASLRSRSGGVWIGADAVVLPGLMLGVAGGADRAEYDADSRSGDAERDGYRLAAYGAGQWGPFGLSAGVSGAWDDIETTRTPIFSGFAETLEADYSAETVQAFAEATWSIPAGPAVVQPFANVARVSTETDGFTETGGAGALSVEDQSQDVTFVALGLGASRAWDQADGRSASLSGRIGWRTASGDLTAANRQTFAGGTAFLVHGLPVEDDVLTAEVGADVQVGEALAVTVDWAAQAGDRTTVQRLSAGLRWRF